MYELGRYNTFEQAVSVRLTVEKYLHDGFLKCWELWQEKASADTQWADCNPFFFSVEKEKSTFRILSAVSEEIMFDY